MARIALGALTTLNLSTHLDAMFVELYGLTLGTTALVSSAAKVSGVEDSTTIGARTKSLVFENNTTTAGAGNDIVWQIDSANANQRWAAISTQIVTNSGSAAAGDLVFSTGAGAGLVEWMRIKSTGYVHQKVPTGAPTLTVNSTVAIDRVDDTHLRVSMRGNDGVTRSVQLTLA